MSPEATALRDYMSDLSEKAWNAGWMSDLEYALWDGVVGGPLLYGRLSLTAEHIERLRQLSNACKGWIRCADNASTEEFVPIDIWNRLVAKRKASPSRPAV